RGGRGNRGTLGRRGDALGGGAGREQSPHHLLQHFDAPLESLQRAVVLVAHGDGGAAAEWDPRTVMTMVTAARMSRLGTQPRSIIGTAICRKVTAKSNAPTSSPSSTVTCRARPKCASKLPVTRATAPCPAPMATALTPSSKSVCQKPTRPGSWLKNHVWMREIANPATTAHSVAHTA